MNLFLLLSPLYASIFLINPKEDLEICKNLEEKTVVLVKTTLMVKNVERLQWSEVESNVPFETSLTIFKMDGLSGNKKEELFHDRKYDSHNVFFFTSYKGAGFYSFIFNVDIKVPDFYGLKVEIFEGNPKSEEIVSGVDYQMTVLTQKVEELLSFARQNFEMEKAGEKDEAKYLMLYNYISKLVFRISLLKIVILFVTIFYFNKSVKNFFISSKIAK
ncbi:hypothetical protein NCER_100279 [Vairimorpha ceranae BRL01]|uniref:GOLD domain-containing protein n=2 Tax=Vairimorpha ceranae TaxID=40302 RepID=C4V762_VAIC1|nr:hypothetical protein AAJ76_500018283 [Vairimorpha ceranae]EEQ82948.1 hypothetical protein NCER_100279 [Vairimorpha ceranae BRL01]KAF5141477.1 hypothetical protein G9O61_00g003400 [Vairimorpha ceranae]KKO76210.1 hypothetical protein AAJ76_500018283 [Vairimorpha ceranae]